MRKGGIVGFELEEKGTRVRDNICGIWFVTQKGRLIVGIMDQEASLAPVFMIEDHNRESSQHQLFKLSRFHA